MGKIAKQLEKVIRKVIYFSPYDTNKESQNAKKVTKLALDIEEIIMESKPIVGSGYNTLIGKQFMKIWNEALNEWEARMGRKK